MSAIAHRYWTESCPILYVCNVPGDGGKDWGYTPKSEQAIELTPYWQRRFAADMLRVGSRAGFRLVAEAA